MEDRLGPFLQNSFGDYYLYPVNRHSFHKLSAEAVYDRHFGRRFQEQSALWLIVGTDSGLLLRYLQQELPASSRAVVVELPEVAARLAETVDLQQLGPHIQLVAPDEIETAFDGFEANQYAYLGRLMLVESLAAAEQHLPDYGELAAVVHDRFDSINWKIQAGLGTRDFIVRQLDNVAENRCFGGCLDDRFAGATAVVLGGGPSLDELIPWVLAHREKLVVLAVSRICGRLQQAGLTPDLIYIIDPHPVSFSVSRECLQFQQDSVLMHHSHASSQLVGQWGGRHLFLGERFPWESSLNEDLSGAPGPTVTHFAIRAALRMGVSQVVLAGVDLCHSREGYSHALGTREREAGVNFKVQLVRVTTNAGWEAESPIAYATGARTLADMALASHKRGVRFVNPAPGAARVEGVEHCPAAEIALTPLNRPAREIIAAALPADGREDRLRYYQAALAEVERIQGELKAMQRLAKEALVANDRLFGRRSKAEFRFKRRLDDIERQLQERYGKTSWLIKQFGTRAFLQLVTPGREVSDWTDAELEAAGRLYYEAYLTGIEDLEKALSEARQRLLLRQEEERPQASVLQLAKQWRADQQCGRADIWLRRHGLDPASFPPDEAQALRELQTEYADVLAGRRELNTSYEELLQLRQSMAGVGQRVGLLFRRRDPEGLRRVIGLLERHGGEQQRAQLLLATGHLAELEDRLPEALAHYHQLLDLADCPPDPLEDALRRISSVSLQLNELENARLALDCLYRLSPVYASQYAELLRIIGRPGDALAVYQDYLGRCPQDHGVVLRLADLCRELGNIEDAVVLVDHVLQADPKNSAAAALRQTLTATSPPTSARGE